MDRSRVFAGVLFLGGGALLYRTVALIDGGAGAVMVPWVAALLWLEFALVLVTMTVCAGWVVTGGPGWRGAGLRLTAALVGLHAVRVAVFVLGRTGPWVDFDVRVEARAGYAERWSWGGVWFAAVMATLSVVVAVAVWRHLRRQKAAPGGGGL